jgi:NADH-quinone oxidoreductase subunit L
MGCPPFAGFFSKDAILMAAAGTSKPIFLLGLFVAFLTAFYMTRLVVVAFLGKARTPEVAHAHDGPAAMTWPLLILAVLSVVAGWSGFSGWVFGHTFMAKLHEIPHAALVPYLASAVFLVGAFMAFVLYRHAERDPVTIPLLRDKFYIDEFYSALIAGTHDLLAALAAFVDKWIIDGLLVRGLSGATWGAGFVLRFFQFGNLQGYAFLFGGGAVLLLFFILLVR